MLFDALSVPTKDLEMDLHQLRLFAAVAELGNLTQAAERLHLSQPAASAKIKLLEVELGLSLFERKPSGLVITRVGASLLPKIQQLLANANDVAMQAKGLSGRVIGSIKFATVPAAFDKSFVKLGKLLNLVATSHSQLDVEVYHRNSRAIIADVANSEFDAGLAFGNKDIPNVRRILLQKLPYRIVAPGTWDDDIRKASWEELASRPWITCTHGGTHQDMLIQMFGRPSCRPNKVIKGDSEQIIAGLVTAGAGLGLMREDLAFDAQAAGNVQIVENGRPSTYLQVLYRTSRENDPAIRAILDALGQLWPQAAQLSLKQIANFK
jgi:DNA-binding transcriptional LysR family regulator